MALRPGETRYKLRGVDNKIVPVDSFCSLIIGWGGVDWIVSSKTNLVVKGGRLVLEGKGTDINRGKEGEIVMDVKEADSPVCCTATVNEPKPTPRPSWVDKLRFGENLSEEEKINLLSVIKRRWRCFPSEDGQIGKTDQAEHLIDTGDAKPVRSAPYRVSRCSDPWRDFLQRNHFLKESRWKHSDVLSISYVLERFWLVCIECLMFHDTRSPSGNTGDLL
ncbi:hypothetical protein DAPPUDRAFT_114668 [Daphnia pulex]|uniref:Uncharacterized protein n=1 Tax=Daphnia pulex TaxID=6669 RepID=E9HIX2_DAPPU|nr:hypothetical protein DAPPUDRAFT_114668 [Daphnia pulex]|eukprot:EFX68315.1 hypothetical protein DAPPUDRAFT_114668 [Daphnia pulex]